MTTYDPDYDEFAELPAQDDNKHDSIYSNDGAEVNAGASAPDDDIYFTNEEDLEREYQNRRDSDRVPPPLPKPVPRKRSSTQQPIRKMSSTQTSISRGIVLSPQNESLPTPPETPKSASYAGESASNSFTRFGGSSRLSIRPGNSQPRENDKDNEPSYCSIKCEKISDWIRNNTWKTVAIVAFFMLAVALLAYLLVWLLGNLYIPITVYQNV